MSKFCSHCGEPVEDNQQVCLKCGTLLNDQAVQKAAPVEEGSSFGWGLLSFFIPIVGLILGIMWKAEKPKTSKTCIIWAIVGFVSSFILSIIVGILNFMLAAGTY